MKSIAVLASVAVACLVAACSASESGATATPQPSSVPTLTPSPSATPASTLPPSSEWGRLDQKLATYVPGMVDGLSFAVTSPDKVLFAKGYGSQTAETVELIASATKLPSALAILTLADEGRLDLDAPVAKYLQGRIDWPADKAAITMRMLLNHTSGLQLEPVCLLGQRIALKDCAQTIARAPLVFAPGTAFGYGGGSFQVAGYVAEVLSGISWNQFFDQSIGRPLGLTRFRYALASADNSRIAGGGESDVGDYSRIVQMVLGGGVFQGKRILSDNTMAELR
ncbi:MAG: beta-lactamase family protein, partial [Chloroflexi bacterium]|nr:beta-lactamase family protein [Chloroflexota bacterium]